MSSCVFLPAWFSRITWSTFAALQLAQPLADRRRRTDQLAAAAALPFRRLLPLLVAFPEVDRAGLERTFLVVERQRELEERPAVRLLPGFLVGVGAHEAADHRDVRVGLVVAELLLVVQEGVVVRVHPGACRVEAHELEARARPCRGVRRT